MASLSTADNRKSRQREVAEASILKFARGSDKNKLVSSTPMGAPLRAAENATKEQWPGPFATAFQIVAKRDAARKERELHQQLAQVTNDENELEDSYYAYQKSMAWPTQMCTSQSFRNIPKLSTIAIKIVVDNIASIDDLEFLAADCRETIAKELAIRRKLDNVFAIKLCAKGSQSLALSDCSLIDEDSLVVMMKHVSGAIPTGTTMASTVVTEQSLQIIDLKYCGHCFGSKAAKCLEAFAGSLEMLSLQGLYRLSDAALAALLSCCAKTLQRLDLSCNSKLSRVGLSEIAQLSQLRALVLDHSTHLTDSDLLCLTVTAPVLRLTELSMAGLIGITDECVVVLMQAYGAALVRLSVEGCVLLTDQSLLAVRNHCQRLQALYIGNIQGFSTTALVALFVNTPEVTVPPPSPGTHQPQHQYWSPEACSSSSSSSSSGLVSACCSKSIGQLTEVSLQRLGSAVTDEVVQQLAEMCRGRLQAVNISGCGGATSSVTALTAAACELPSSTSSSASVPPVPSKRGGGGGGGGITARSLAALVINCSQSLTSLDISFVRSLGEDKLAALVHACPLLCNLKVWGCTQLTSKFHDYINNSGRHIKYEGKFGIVIK